MFVTMPNLQQISKGKGKGHNMTCICGQRGEAEVQLQPILNLSTRRGGYLAIRSGRSVTQKGLVYIWVNGNGKNLTPVGIQSPDCPVCSQPLCIK